LRISYFAESTGGYCAGAGKRLKKQKKIFNHAGYFLLFFVSTVNTSKSFVRVDYVLTGAEKVVIGIRSEAVIKYNYCTPDSQMEFYRQ